MFRFRAKSSRPRREPGKMNGTEKVYADALELRLRAGEILRYDFEPEKLRLAKGTFYDPDFRVIMADGTMEFHEVKGGFIRDDAMVKIKVAAALHPYVFRMIKITKKGWVEEIIGG